MSNAMTDDAITPDRLRLAGWDRESGTGLFVREGGEGPPSVWHSWGAWYWEISGLLENGSDIIALTGMADVAARLAAVTGVARG